MSKLGRMARAFLCMLLALMLSLSGVAEGVLTDDTQSDAIVEPVAEVEVVEEPVVEEPEVVAPVVEDPVVEAPVVEEPVVEEPVTEEPVVEEPVVEEPVVEAPVVEEPVTEEPVVEEPVVEEPEVEEPVTEEPVVGKPVTEEPVEDETIEVPFAKTAGTGWETDEKGNYYYRLNGELVTGQVIEIDGKYYGFADDGMLFEDTSFGFYSDELERFVYYQAKADGSLYVCEWAEYDYYYGEGGESAYGVQTVDGTTYWFDSDGQWMSWVDGIVNFEGNAYMVEGGIVVADFGTDDGWKSYDGNYYYVLYGELVCEQVIQIDGYYYGFDSNGRMYDNDYFGVEIYDEDGNWIDSYYYHALPGGKLATNAWGYDGYDTMYFGEDGAAVWDGLIVDNGKLYWIEEYDMQRDRLWDYSEEEGPYYFDANGVGKDLGKTQGWRQIGKRWCYVKADGRLASDEVVLIDGKYYGFSYMSWMFVDCEFEAYVDGVCDFYRAKSNGTLYANEWCKVANQWFYYGDNAAAAFGPTDVNGTLYYFDWTGKMLTNCMVAWSGTNYIVNANGIAKDVGTTDGWKSVGNHWYYISDGMLVQDKVIKINGAYYGFDEYGRMYDNEAFEAYDSGSRWNSFRAKSGGALYVNELYSDGFQIYYYGAEGKAARYELLTLDGKTYYLQWDGSPYTDTYFTYGGAAYYADDNGVCTKLSDGWVLDQKTKQYRYVQDGSFVYNEIIDVNGKKYLLYAGWLIENQVYYNEDTGVFYIALPGGELYTTPGWKLFNGKWYYVQEDGTLFEGVLEQGGTLYFMTPAMKKLSSDAAIGEDENDIGTVYTVATNGVLTETTKDGFYRVQLVMGGTFVCYLRDGEVVKDDWVTVDGYKYYFDVDGWRVEWPCWIDGKDYVFDNDGRLLTNTFVTLYTDEDGSSCVGYAMADGSMAEGLVVIDGKKYYFDFSSGDIDCFVMQFGAVNYDGGLHFHDLKEGYWIADLTEGWNLVNGEWYYVKYGTCVQNDTVVENGKLYYFDKNGRMVKDCTDAEAILGEDAWDYGENPVYLFDANGVAVSGWALHNGCWYYADPSTFVLYTDGEYSIGGSVYRFDWDGRMVTGDYIEESDYNIYTLYRYAENGAKTGEYTVSEGWTYVDGSVFYCRNGRGYTGWVGDYYVHYGWMYMDDIYWIDDYNYCFDEYGRVCKNQWCCYDWYYAKADGKLACNEWLTIDGATYYFNGVEKVTRYWTIDGRTYQFDEDGKYIGEMSSLMKASGQKDGWVQKGGNWYYVSDGYYLYNTLAKINGAYYGFDYRGIMTADNFAYPQGDCGFWGTYYFTKSGAMNTKSGWQRIGGAWYYFDGDGRLYEDGWHFIGGKKYYFAYQEYNDSYAPCMVTGYWTINNRIYYFGTDGALDPSKSPAITNGWYKLGSDWYYYQGGKTVKEGIYKINGTTYGFDEEGRMVTDWVVYSGDGRYCTDSNGVVVTKQGWRKVSGLWVYIGANGRLYANGLYKINGVDYAFDWSGFMVE